MKSRALLPLFAFLTLAGALCAAGNHTKGAEVAQVSQGAAIDLADYVVTGKTTIFDFSSDYCGPCRAYTVPLAQLHAKRADIAVVRVDVNRPNVKRIDWASPVVQKFGLESIPHFKIYGADGKLIAEDSTDGSAGAARQMVDKWIQELGQ
jgi:thiol-disulfide isomerase/thioredoxin